MRRQTTWRNWRIRRTPITEDKKKRIDILLKEYELAEGHLNKADDRMMQLFGVVFPLLGAAAAILLNQRSQAAATPAVQNVDVTPVVVAWLAPIPFFLVYALVLYLLYFHMSHLFVCRILSRRINYLAGETLLLRFEKELPQSKFFSVFRGNVKFAVIYLAMIFLISVLVIAMAYVSLTFIKASEHFFAIITFVPIYGLVAVWVTLALVGLFRDLPYTYGNFEKEINLKDGYRGGLPLNFKYERSLVAKDQGPEPKKEMGQNWLLSQWGVIVVPLVVLAIVAALVAPWEAKSGSSLQPSSASRAGFVLTGVQPILNPLPKGQIVVLIVSGTRGANGEILTITPTRYDAELQAAVPVSTAPGKISIYLPRGEEDAITKDFATQLASAIAIYLLPANAQTTPTATTTPTPTPTPTATTTPTPTPTPTTTPASTATATPISSIASTPAAPSPTATFTR